MKRFRVDDEDLPEEIPVEIREDIPVDIREAAYRIKLASARNLLRRANSLMTYLYHEREVVKLELSKNDAVMEEIFMTVRYEHSRERLEVEHIRESMPVVRPPTTKSRPIPKPAPIQATLPPVHIERVEEVKDNLRKARAILKL